MEKQTVELTTLELRAIRFALAHTVVSIGPRREGDTDFGGSDRRVVDLVSVMSEIQASGVLGRD